MRIQGKRKKPGEIQKRKVLKKESGFQKMEQQVPPVIIAPSLLNCDFAYLANEAKAVTDNGADWLHMDVMVNRFSKINFFRFYE